MTAHEIAKLLLAGPDVPVIVNGWENASLESCTTISCVNPPCERVIFSSPDPQICVRIA